MTTAVQELMSSPPVTCSAQVSLTEATELMDRRQIGALVVTDGPSVRRDPHRAGPPPGLGRPHRPVGAEPVRRWMTPDPDVLALDEEVGAAWSGLSHHHYRHLPVVDGGSLVGVVSIRDLLSVAQIRPTDEAEHRRTRRARGSGGGRDLHRGRAGPRGVLPLPPVLGHRAGRPPIVRGRLVAAVRRHTPRPDPARRGSGPRRRPGGRCPRGWRACCPPWPPPGPPSTPCAPASRSSERSWAGTPPSTSVAAELRSQALRLCAVVPTLLAAAHRLRRGERARTPEGRSVTCGQLPVDADRGGSPRPPTSAPWSST